MSIEKSDRILRKRKSPAVERDRNPPKIRDQKTYGSLEFEVLQIDLIMKEIMKNLSVPDLLKVSLVNKYFQTQVITYLRESRKCIAEVRGDKPCHVLQLLENVLQKSKPIPFNGLSVATTEEHHKCIPCCDVYKAFPVLLTKLEAKYLKVDWKWSLDTSCPAQQLLRILLKEKSSMLEELTIRELPWGEFNRSSTFNHQSPGIWLNNLKVLEFSSDVEIDLIEKIIPCAPQLCEIRGRVFPEHLKFLIPQRKVQLIKDFRLYPELSTTDLLAQFAQDSPRLESLEISSDELRKDYASMETFKIVLASVLEASSNSLKRLRIDEHLDIMWFSNLRLPTLRNLHYLYLHYELDLDKKVGYSTLSRINWDRLFPRLQSVEISLRTTPHNMLKRLLEGDSLVMSETSEYVCSTVTKLSLPDLGRYNRELYAWLVQVFPNLKHLDTVFYMEYPEHMSALCKWPDLETIAIQFKTRSFRFSIDSTLGGIFPDEVEDLRNKDEQFLRRYQFVPIKPCLLTLHKLKSLHITQLHHQDCYSSQNPDIRLMTELTDYLVLSRIPHVKVEFCRKEWKITHCATF